MALKSVLENIEGIPADVAKEYEEKDGKFYLIIEGLDAHPGVGALKRAKDHEKELRRKAEEKLAEFEDKLTQKENEIEGLRTGAIPKGDVEALESSYKKKLKDREDELTGKYDNLQRLVNKTFIDAEALKLATEISTVPTLLVPHIKSRLTVEEAEGELTVRVLDTEGKPSAHSLADLRKELLSNKAFAPILVGSRASGGGANGGSGGGGASKTFAQMNEAERTAYAKENPEGFRADLAESKKAAASKY